mmetsp:Transcript_25572/g.59634  ORF Transcript_25572/g.59634 Transcript_25572/m.59634 type:complete len:208 (+) Transcript_25572:640-1263(+)
MAWLRRACGIDDCYRNYCIGGGFVGGGSYYYLVLRARLPGFQLGAHGDAHPNTGAPVHRHCIQAARDQGGGAEQVGRVAQGRVRQAQANQEGAGGVGHAPTLSGPASVEPLAGLHHLGPLHGPQRRRRPSTQPERDRGALRRVAADHWARGCQVVGRQTRRGLGALSRGRQGDEPQAPAAQRRHRIGTEDGCQAGRPGAVRGRPHAN